MWSGLFPMAGGTLCPRHYSIWELKGTSKRKMLNAEPCRQGSEKGQQNLVNSPGEGPVSLGSDPVDGKMDEIP